MKILCVSDLHGESRWYEWLLQAAREADLVSIAGDLLDAFHTDGIQWQMDYLLEDWLPRWPEETTSLALSSGNHDYDNGWMSALPQSDWLVPNGESRVVKVAGGERITVTTTPYPETPDDLDKILPLWETGARLRGQTRSPWLVLFHEPPASNCPEMGSSLLDDLIEEWSPTFVHCGHDHELPSRRGCFVEPVGLSKIINAGCVEGTESPCAVTLDLQTGDAIRTWWQDEKQRTTRARI